MTRLRALADKVLSRGHAVGHIVDTVSTDPAGSIRGVDTLFPNDSRGLGLRNERVHVSTRRVDGQMDKGQKSGHASGRPVDTVCRRCGEPVDWRPSAPRTAVPFLDGTVAHLACDDAAEVARVLAGADRVMNSPDALADMAELMLQTGGLSE